MQPRPIDAMALVGPTASGKTAAALALAQALEAHGGAEIISMDSALVYRGMDIGTAKPTREELAQVPHHLIDIIDPLQSYSAADFVRDATQLMADIRIRGKTPLIVGGTMFLMWLGEQITARGIGNGTSLIIFVGIVAEIPKALANFLSQGRSGAISPAVIIGVIVMIIVVIALVVFMERALRKIHIQYPRRQVGMKVYDGGSSHLPVKVNPAGVIPAIFASSLLLLPTTIATFSGQGTGPILSTILAYFGPGRPLYLAFFTGMIVFFTYFYTYNVSFKVDEVAENLKNQNGFIPGIRPGKKTEEFLEYVVTRIMVLGSAYLALICLLPEILRSQLAIPFYFGGTSVLIVVSVTMDTINQVQSHLLAHQYEGLIEKSQLRGRKRSGSKAPARR